MGGTLNYSIPLRHVKQRRLKPRIATRSTPSEMDDNMRNPSWDNLEVLHEQRDWLLVTLSSIGDAVITTDRDARVTFLNPVAEGLTGWGQVAVGQPVTSVIRIFDEESRRPIEIPSVQALQEDRPD